MIAQEQFEKAKQFIFRQGRLIDRKRFLYHFSGGSKEAVLQVLACYQNDGGGFGHGLELDVTCPASTCICTEMAMFYLDEIEATDGRMVDEIKAFVTAAVTGTAESRHPKDEILAYPHGDWWEGDSGSPLSVVGMLARWGRGTDALFDCSRQIYTSSDLPEELGVYDYPRSLYLRHAPGAEDFAADLRAVRDGLRGMLEKVAWHCPLYFHYFGWYSDDTPQDLLRSEAEKAIGTLQEDGGVRVAQYEKIASYPVWRAVWTLDMLVALKRYGLLDERRTT